MHPVPLSLVRSGRDLTEPKVSPDGSRVAFVQRVANTASIVAVGADGRSPEQLLGFGAEPAPGRGLGGGCFTWVVGDDGTTSIVYAGRDGELWHQRGSRLEQLTEHGRETRAPVTADRRSTSSPTRLVAYVVDEAEVRVLDLVTGADRRVDDGAHEFCFDPALSPDESRVSWQAWSPPAMAWDAAVRVDVDLESGERRSSALDDGAIQQPRFTPDGGSIDVRDGSGWANVHLDSVPLVPEPIEQAGPTWGMGNRSFAVSDTSTRLAFTRNEDGFGALYVADLGSGDVVRLGRGVHGHLSWVGETLVAIRSGARTPTCVVRYDTTSLERTTLAYSAPVAWSEIELPEPDLVRVEHDGTTLHARRFVAGEGRLLAWVHGGPTDQWQVEWRPRIAYWWSRGWDVLVVDPRGTTGHGRTYQQALRGAWGRLDVDDTAALIAHAHSSGWSTPATTAAMGGSSGGLTVLGLLADHPASVAAGVASYPVSDLRALTEVTHRFEAHYTDTLVAPNDGSPASDAAFETLSPIHRAETITSPLLIFHGTDDPVVPIGQSEALVERVRAAGGDVEFVTYEGEGHGFRQAENVTDEYERTEAFLERFVVRSSTS